MGSDLQKDNKIHVLIREMADLQAKVDRIKNNGLSNVEEDLEEISDDIEELSNRVDEVETWADTLQEKKERKRKIKTKKKIAGYQFRRDLIVAIISALIAIIGTFFTTWMLG